MYYTRTGWLLLVMSRVSEIYVTIRTSNKPSPELEFGAVVFPSKLAFFFVGSTFKPLYRLFLVVFVEKINKHQSNVRADVSSHSVSNSLGWVG